MKKNVPKNIKNNLLDTKTLFSKKNIQIYKTLVYKYEKTFDSIMNRYICCNIPNYSDIGKVSLKSYFLVTVHYCGYKINNKNI